MAETTVTLNGKVKWFDSRRGFGFLEGEDDVDYFIHFSEIEMDGFKKLSAGQVVEFEGAADEKGPLAKAIRIISEE